ncbi:hypothetical protein LJK87_45135 [Paenibacillus sp. P25]|nr:hypothetical protein LJK87_45135 [Paenibacillus sp. P25]
MQTSYGKRTLIHLLLAVLCIINIIPILWMIVGSFKSEEDFAVNPLGLPKQWNFSNYASAWKVAHLGTYFWNSVVVTAGAIVLTVLLGALTSYFLSRFEYRLRGWVYGLFVIGMTIPIHATLVPIFILMKKIGASTPISRSCFRTRPFTCRSPFSSWSAS